MARRGEIVLTLALINVWVGFEFEPLEKIARRLGMPGRNCYEQVELQEIFLESMFYIGTLILFRFWGGGVQSGWAGLGLGLLS